jgi:hypothetical protein
MNSQFPAAAIGCDAPTAAAANTAARALDAFLRAVGDPLAQTQHLLERYPTFAAGYVLRVAVAVAAKDPASLAWLDETLRAADSAPVRWSARERAHLAAAHAWRSGDPAIAAERYVAVLRESPHDLLALRLAQSCYLFLGQTTALCEVVDLIWHSWRDGMPGFQYVLAMAAFACAENGQAQHAHRLAQRALEIEPASPAAIHAVAHALFDAGEHARGAQWLHQRWPHWGVDSRMAGHNAWHLATSELESGNAVRALVILDRDLLPASMTSLGDATDATSLLWRLQLDGVDPGRRWQRLSELWAAHSVPGFWGLLDVHAAIAFNAAGHVQRARQHVSAIERCAQGDTHAAEVARSATLAAVRAIAAFAGGAWGKACVQLRALLSSVHKLGGSHAQHEVFVRMLHHAQERSYDAEAVIA